VLKEEEEEEEEDEDEEYIPTAQHLRAPALLVAGGGSFVGDDADRVHAQVELGAPRVPRIQARVRGVAVQVAFERSFETSFSLRSFEG
jgi:hypothetical protein